MISTSEQQTMLNGEQGEIMAKIVKTLVMYMNNPLCKKKAYIT